MTDKEESRHPSGDPAAEGLSRHSILDADCGAVYDALASLDGLRGWWTTIVSGEADAGGTIRFEFAGMDERILMHVDVAERPTIVRWTCLEHSGLPEWNGTKLEFHMLPVSSDRCDLRFRHVGLTPALECFEDCRRGWDHFLASLAEFVERGKGTPFGK